MMRQLTRYLHRSENFGKTSHCSNNVPQHKHMEAVPKSLQNSVCRADMWKWCCFPDSTVQGTSSAFGDGALLDTWFVTWKWFTFAAKYPGIFLHTRIELGRSSSPALKFSGFLDKHVCWDLTVPWLFWLWLSPDRPVTACCCGNQSAGVSRLVAMIVQLCMCILDPSSLGWTTCSSVTAGRFPAADELIHTTPTIEALLSPLVLHWYNIFPSLTNDLCSLFIDWCSCSGDCWREQLNCSFYWLRRWRCRSVSSGMVVCYIQCVSSLAISFGVWVMTIMQRFFKLPCPACRPRCG